jgi:bifunctional non-homologous end joining protein LigD
MSLDGEDFRYEPFSERKAVLRKVLSRGIQYVEHTEGDGMEMFKAICKLGLEGIVSKKRACNRVAMTSSESRHS